MSTSDVIAETEAKIAALKLRLPSLDGKEHKKERTVLNKEIYKLENDELYVAALKAAKAVNQAEAKAADDAAHAEQLAKEEAAARSKWAKAGCAETDSERTLRIYWRNQVEGLFDEYAPTFEHSLVQTLGYDVPEKLEAALALEHADADGMVSRRLAIDLGCGLASPGLSFAAAAPAGSSGATSPVAWSITRAESQASSTPSRRAIAWPFCSAASSRRQPT